MSHPNVVPPSSSWLSLASASSSVPPLSSSSSSSSSPSPPLSSLPSLPSPSPSSPSPLNSRGGSIVSAGGSGVSSIGGVTSIGISSGQSTPGVHITGQSTPGVHTDFVLLSSLPSNPPSLTIAVPDSQPIPSPSRSKSCGSGGKTLK